MAVDLGKLEARLNNDASLRARFFKDPVAVLAEEGLVLTPDMQSNLARMVGETQGKPTKVAGSTLGPSPQEVGIGISIGKSF